MTLLAVTVRYWVTQGADQWVPFSGCQVPRLTGQVTRAGSMTTGTAKSEPHGASGTAGGRGARVLW